MNKIELFISCVKPMTSSSASIRIPCVILSVESPLLIVQECWILLLLCGILWDQLQPIAQQVKWWTMVNINIS